MDNLTVDLLEGALATWNQAMHDIFLHLTTAPEAFNGGAPWAVATSVNTALQGIGYGLLMLFFAMGFLKRTVSFRDLSVQEIVGYIIRFGLTKALIDYCMAILAFFISLAMGVNNIIFDVSGAGSLPPVTCYCQVKFPTLRQTKIPTFVFKTFLF